MSGVWWGRESTAAQRSPQPPRRDATPELMPADRARLIADLDARAPAFTPEWTRGDPSKDSGAALRQLFGEQLEAVVQRLDRWPEKALTEFLNIAGITPLVGAPAEVLLEFEVVDNAPRSLLVAAGFQVGARSPGASALVIFETERSLYAAPGKIGEMFAVSGRTFDPIDTARPFAPFGDGRTPGASLLIGLTGDNAPSQSLTLGIGVASPPGAPPPVGAGGVLPLPVPSGPALVWEILDGGTTVPLEVVRDETGGLIRSGLIELALPRQWRAGRPGGLPVAKARRWVSLRLAYGRFSEAPKLSFVKLNVARAAGAHTVRDEIVEPVPGSDRRRARLSQTPVVAGSLRLEVATSGLELGQAADALAAPADDAQAAEGWSAWSEVPDLSASGPDEPVYVLEPTTGEITFGDGRFGRALPAGFRNVRAASYRALSPAPERVDAGVVSTAVNSLEFLGKVSNPLPASGGGPGETPEQAIRRGPLELRARGRAVTIADYTLLALRAEGAQVARAFAVSGLHPHYPGRPIPGVVGVFVVPPDRGEGQPTPDPDTLRAVATYLSRNAAPAGVEVVAGAPRYHDVAVSVGVLLEASADSGATVRRLLQAINTYLHPLTGGEVGDGWPFGGTIRYVPLLRRVSRIRGIRAVKRLNVVLDGLRKANCQDVPLTPYSLLWPAGHDIFVLDDGGSS
jgi:predicted phage baseplate assembly protein